MKFVTLILSTLLFSQMAWSNETVKIATLEWPPYLGQTLPSQGFGIVIIKEAFKAEGINDVHVDFLPWSRALLVVDKGKSHGLLFAYHSKEREEKYIYSDPVTTAPIKFAMRRDKIIQWKRLTDLKDKKIGVVRDYVNSSEMDELITNKTLTVNNAFSDFNNLEKLALKRIDLAVIDENVYTFLIKTRPELAKHRDNLVLTDRVLDDKKFYVLFAKNKEGERLVKIFNRGLKKIRPKDIAKKYLKKL